MVPRYLVFCLSLLPHVLGACNNLEIRKEWRNFTVSEKTAWIDAVKCMAQLPHNDSLTPTVGEFASIANVTSNSSFYDDFVYIHSDLNPTIHFTGLFLPFHRYFVWAYNKALKESCGYTGVTPYWDWTIDSSDMKASSLWDNDTASGLGGPSGDADNDYVMDSGAFATNFTLAYPSVHGLRRNFTIQPFVSFAISDFFTEPQRYANESVTPEYIDQMIANTTGDFKAFQKIFEAFEGPHASIHEVLGGDLGGYCPEDASESCFENAPSPTFSANEPLFWLHHAMVDKVWWQWQNANPNNTYAFSAGSVQNISTVASYNEYPNGAAPALSMNSTLPGDGILDEPTLSSVWITEEDYLCYTYE